MEFECAAPGMVGLETAVPLVLELVRAGVIDAVGAIRLLTAGPAAAWSLLVIAHMTLRGWIGARIGALYAARSDTSQAVGSGGSGWVSGWVTIPKCYQAVNSNASRWPGPSSCSQPCCWLMSPPAAWTSPRVRR